MAGCGAGAFNATNSTNGELGMSACDKGSSLLCDKQATSLAMNFISFLCIAINSGLAYFRVHKVALK